MIFKKKDFIGLQSFGEEIANAITHGIGIILSIIALLFLLNGSYRGTTAHVVSSALYGGSLFILYTFSTLYHSIFHEKAKKVLRRLDHIGIYLLIAGTCMPIALVALKGTLGWMLFGIECGMCLIGVVFKAVFGARLGVLSTIFYLLMGWVAMIVIKPIAVAISFNGFVWMVLGGVFYSLGVIFFAIDKKVSYFHALWHLFVLAGSICHFFMVFLYVIPIV